MAGPNMNQGGRGRPPWKGGW